MAGNESKSEDRLSLKIIVDIKAKKVVFAEAGNEFVDFVLQILSLPLSTVTKLLSENNMKVGSLGSLCNSVEHLSAKHFKSNVIKDSILNPKSNVRIPLLAARDSSTAMKVYRCPNHCFLVSNPADTTCDICSHAYILVASSYSGGYMNGDITYLVTDNLEVKEMSFTHIKSLVRDFDSLEEKQVEVGLKEGVAILKASLEGNAVLTAAFLNTIIAPTEDQPNPESRAALSSSVRLF